MTVIETSPVAPMRPRPRSRPASVLLIDPLRGERRALTGYLTAQDLAVVEADHVDEARQPMDDHDVVVVAASLPDPAVSAFIRRSAEADGPPILVMSETAEYVERVLALELGADDLVPREVNPRELLARLRGLMRRRHRRRDAAPRLSHGVVATWTLQLSSRALLAPTGRRIDLSRADLALLTAFADDSDSQILDNNQPGGSLRTAVSRLRQRALSHAQIDLPIRNVRGLGYRFDAPISKV